MGCCGAMSARPRGVREEKLLRVPGASVHLMAGSDGPVEIARGDLAVVRITKDDVAVAAVVRVGRDLGWPLARDEPVVKLDRLHYLFTLPDKDGTFLNYGVSFAATAADATALASLDSFLSSNACFSAPSAVAASLQSSSRPTSSDGYWNDFEPRMEGYNGVLAKAIASGTGQLVKGIFMCSEAYASQVQRGADLFRPQAAGDVSNRFGGADRSSQASTKRGGVNKSLKRVRKLSEMTEKMSQSLLDTVISVTGSMAAPLLRSKQRRAFVATVPGEVILASLDAINKVIDAVEAAEKRSLAATSSVVAGAVSRRYGESAGEATEDAFATAGHAVGTAWNLFKIRKAVTPSSSLPGNMVKSAVRKRN
ncbi:senescence/dehydration-associated protein At4g35985, chloroplastic-like [Phragmites australis]|uniref:senescence/dehydration-associated protein At4g35985, chloroplastic-like n=1 Tax=Phragmites australis TaxID=29695 RepID=UPI002D785961|nr:senescence/dehydration-associated protein At4g35985, chloroplastic-like [Phragmites australis]